ncbi:hypothetical protein AVEN_174236-1 [Araneus ventricosus]|uniref:Uncharacterized protein n=1 Tax=Araneus ventricosus TaxID=182803 RepID=A0A4Y2NT66_ARAVE|nr:hypothetical protein AVEN_174236-1 [Araneus ventricosus]
MDVQFRGLAKSFFWHCWAVWKTCLVDDDEKNRKVVGIGKRFSEHDFDWGLRASHSRRGVKRLLKMKLFISLRLLTKVTECGI